MHFEPISELRIAAILSRGVPNQECIAIYVQERVNMGQFGLALCLDGGLASVVPAHDHFFWFGEGLVSAGDWILVFTGPGVPKSTDHEVGGSRTFSCFWGKASTILADSNAVPALLQVSRVSVAAKPANAPQAMLALGDS